MPILRVKDEHGNEIPIPAIRGKSAYEYAKDGGYTGTEDEFKTKLAAEWATKEEVSELSEQKVDKTYIVSVFGELKQVLQGGDIDSAIAILDEAILDLSTLA